MMKKEEIAEKCIQLLLKYYDEVAKPPYDHNKLYSFDQEDMELWKSRYYQELKKYPEIEDAAFIQKPGEENENCGVGADGVFNKFEYCNLYCQLYRCLGRPVAEQVQAMMPPGALPVADLIGMLESYAPLFSHKGNGDGEVLKFSEEHMELWKEFYKLNAKVHLIQDGEFFGDIEEQPNLGIGEDGAFYGAELLHFIGNCYRYLWETAKSFLK